MKHYWYVIYDNQDLCWVYYGSSKRLDVYIRTDIVKIRNWVIYSQFTEKTRLIIPDFYVNLHDRDD